MRFRKGRLSLDRSSLMMLINECINAIDATSVNGQSQRTNFARKTPCYEPLSWVRFVASDWATEICNEDVVQLGTKLTFGIENGQIKYSDLCSKEIN